MADYTWVKRLHRYLKPDLLILDNFALKEFTKTQAEDLYELIDRRYRSGILILKPKRNAKTTIKKFDFSRDKTQCKRTQRAEHIFIPERRARAMA